MTSTERFMVFDGKENRLENDAEYSERQQRLADAEAAVQEAEKTAIEIAWVELRMKRDRWLAQTDPFMLSTPPPDFPADKIKEIESNKQAWTDFRQALRDLPANTADPREAVWPTQPSAPKVNLT